MRYSVRTIDREFTPSEAAAITGVSTALQRDWRRRGIVQGDPSAEGKWTRWNLRDIIRLSVMKLFSDAGMEVSSTTIVAGMALMPILGALARIDAAVQFDGDEITEDQKARIRFNTVRTTHPSHLIGRFIVSFGRGEYDVCRTDNLASLDSILDKEPRPILSIVDCESVARLIVERAGSPVLRYETKAHAE